MNHLAAAETAIYKTISSHPVMAEINGIYSGIVPEGAEMPYVVVELAMPEDCAYAPRGNKLVATFKYLIEVFMERESSSNEIAAKVDAALQDYRETITIGEDTHNVFINRTHVIARDAQYRGCDIYRSGGIYLVTVN